MRYHLIWFFKKWKSFVSFSLLVNIKMQFCISLSQHKCRHNVILQVSYHLAFLTRSTLHYNIFIQKHAIYKYCNSLNYEIFEYSYLIDKCLKFNYIETRNRWSNNNSCMIVNSVAKKYCKYKKGMCNFFCIYLLIISHNFVYNYCPLTNFRSVFINWFPLKLNNIT